MRLPKIAHIHFTALVLVCFGLDSAFPAGSARNFRISAVQEMQIWIEGGLLDGLEQGMEGEVCYEIFIAGQKKRIVPAKVRLVKVEDREAVGALREQSGTVNIGYNASFVERPANAHLLLFNKRASESYASGNFKLAQQYYRRILDILPGDVFASQKIKDCEAQLEKLNALERERQNIPYYREVIRASLDANSPESLKLVQTYSEKILAVEPGDPEAIKAKDRLHQLASASAAKPVQPPSTPVAENGPKPIPVTDINKAPEKEPAVGSKIQNSPGILKNMVLIPEMDYSIGSVTGASQFMFDNEAPKHTVHIQAFYFDKYEVTNEEYKKFCDATGRSYPGYFSDNKYPSGTAKKPVVMISWTDADAYARWAGKRLPSEIEWEAAAAGPTGREWPWGNSWTANDANTREKGESDPADVGSHPFDVSEFGIFDMAGNVSEWTQDWYKPYPGNTRREKEYGEQFKVLRGGSAKASKRFARSQFRGRLPDSFRSMDLGFRCAVSAKDIKN